MSTSIQRMSTGNRINSAKDDAAGYSVIQNMAVKLSSFHIVKDNTSQGLSYIGTATSNLDNMTAQLQRIRDLVEQASNDSYGSDIRNGIQQEINQRLSQVNRILSETEYNGKNVFQGSTFNNSVNPLTESEATAQGYTIIRNASDLQNINSNLSGKYILMGDVDLSSVPNWDPIGDFYNAFRGTLDGNGYKITNLTINNSDSSGSSDTGLFAWIEGTIKNLGITGANVVSLGDRAGILSGEAGNAHIDNCYVQGSVSGKNTVGGFTGTGSIVTNSYSMANVTGNDRVGGIVGGWGGTVSNSYATGNISGNSDVGGLMGETDGCTISNCYATGNVTGNINVGSFLGWSTVFNSGTIKNCYATGTATGGSNIGGFIGLDESSSTLTNCVYSTSTNTVGVGSGPSTGVFGLTIQDIKNESIMQGYGYTAINGWSYDSTGLPVPRPSQNIVSLNVGVDQESGSAISIDTGFQVSLTVDVSSSGNANNSLASIDSALSKITAKQTILGAASNRLQSASDSIDVSITNLTSSISTIRDTDVAQESLTYIRQQILQQASISLLTAANQSASIALSLI